MFAAEFAGVFAQGFEQLKQAFAQRPLAKCDRVGNHRRHAVTAGLEFVVTGDVGLQTGMQFGSGAQQPAAERLRQRGQRAGLFNCQRGIADADFNGAEFGFRPDIPVKVLDAAGNAAGLQKAEMPDKFGPVGQWRTLAAERKGRDGVEPG